MDKPLIIGISGKKRSGKDTVYEIIKELNRGATLRLAFADALKEELCGACKVSPEFLEQNKTAFRGGLQWWGTEFRRNLFGETYWIDQARARLEKLAARCEGPNTVICFTDVRFPNEFEFLKSVGGAVIRVHRARFTTVDEHPSETALDTYAFDAHVINSGTLDELKKAVTFQFARLSGRRFYARA